MKFLVRGQSLEISGQSTVAEGAVAFASFTLECDKKWDGYSLTVRFRHASSPTVYDVAGVRDGGVYYIPAEVLVRGNVYVSVLGVCGTYSISTTNRAEFFVEGTLSSGEVPTVSENAYAQYVSQVCEKADEAENSAKEAAASEKNAEISAKNALSAEESCKDSTLACSGYAEECRRIASHTGGAENSMNLSLERVKDCIDTLLSRDSSLSLSEYERKAGENDRQESEKLREEGEQKRICAENERSLAEAERISAERGRVAGEKLREERVSGVEKALGKVCEKLFLVSSAVIGKYTGERITVYDADAKVPEKAELTGTSFQEHAPSRTNPVKIESAGDSGKIFISHCGKNYISFPYTIESEYESGGVKYSVESDGCVSVTGETGDMKSYAEITPADFTLDAGHYVVSGGTGRCGVFVYSSEKSAYIARSVSGDAEFTLESPSVVKVRLYIYANTRLCCDKVFPMIRQFGSDGTYEKHFEKIYTLPLSRPLCSISGECGKFADSVITGRTEAGHTVYRTSRYTADGTESVALEEECEDGYTVFSLTSPSLEDAKEFYPGMYYDMGFCTHFPYADDLSEECCHVRGDKIYLKLKSEDFPDASSVQAFLSKSHGEFPVEFLYVSKEPEQVPITLGEKAELLREFNTLEASEGVLSIEYTRDASSVFESIIDTLVTLDARISLLELKS